MKEIIDLTLQTTRRHFLSRASRGIGSAALSSILGPGIMRNSFAPNTSILRKAAKAKRVIYLFQSGGPSQLELYDYKPKLNEMFGQQLPDSIRQGQRLTAMSAGQSSFPLAGSVFDFQQHGESRAWVSELMPHIASIADDLCFIKSMKTEAINHDPAITFFQTGNQIAGRPSFGSWLSYGLGSDNENLPAFMVLISKNGSGQPLYSRLWGSGFLPSLHSGVQLRNGIDPVLYLNDPDGLSREDRRQMMDSLEKLQRLEFEKTGDEEINSRIAQYEMAYRMQISVPELMDLSDEPDHIFDLYGPDSRDPGSYAANCLMARRLAEKGVKFIQLYHQGWDQHGNLPSGIKYQSKNTDQASAALIKDLKQRGMLDDTLVIWGGEFGRTNYSQGKLTLDNYGRDHHPRSFTIWAAGGGIKPGISYGQTDEFGYNIVKDEVHVHDLHATLLHLLGVDHERMTFKHQGRQYRLTDVHGKIVQGILS